ncbi:GNAT family N-acetyltransferase [Bacillaceae bacterium W0354]
MLTDQQLSDIERLQMITEQHDKIELKLRWYFLHSRKTQNNDFFYYEGEQLLGYLALYYVGGAYELCGMVHPKHRQKGIFTQLFNQVLDALKTRKSKTLYINAPPESETAKKTLEKMGAKYAYSDYQMRWSKQDLDEEDASIKLRNATRTDFETCVNLDMLGFNLTKEESKYLNEVWFDEIAHRILMIEHEGKVVGKIQLKSEGIESYIFGFTVFPEYRRQGIGRKALTEAVRMESELGHVIFVEVGTDDETGLHLYESVGFKTFQTQDYYRYMWNENLA